MTRAAVADVDNDVDVDVIAVTSQVAETGRPWIMPITTRNVGQCPT